MPGVPGKGGRVPKRSDQRHGHRTKAEQSAVETVEAIGNVDPGELLVDFPHVIVQELWDAALDSAQRRYMEPTDWAQLQLVLHEINHYLNAKNKNGQILATLMSALGDLLFTEGSRRRVRLEIDRNANNTKAPVIDLEAMKRSMGG